MIHHEIHPGGLSLRSESRLGLNDIHKLHSPCVHTVKKEIPVLKCAIARIDVLVVRAVAFSM